MNYRPLGRTGLRVSELCFGTMTFGGEGVYKAIGATAQGEADRLVGLCLDAGINFFDTADVYSMGRAEEILGKALGTRRRDVVVASKVRGRVGPGPNAVGLSRGHIMDAVDASLRRLGTDYIDLYQIHGFDALSPWDETLRALDDLVRAGKVRYIGASNLAAWQLMKALGLSERDRLARFETIQSYYSLAGRDLEREIVPLLQSEQVGLLVWSPLAGGFLGGKFSRERRGPDATRRSSFSFPPVDEARGYAVLDALAEVAGPRQVSVPRLALAWLLHQPVTTSVIVGARDEGQLRDNLAAAELTLSPDELDKLNAASALPPEYPGLDDRGAGARSPGGDLAREALQQGDLTARYHRAMLRLASRALLLSFLVLGSAVCGGGKSSMIGAAFLRVDGTDIVDGAGNTAFLKGVSFGNEVWSNAAIPDDHGEIDFERLATMGATSTRFLLNYRTFEDDAAPGVYKQAGWDWIDQNVAWAKANGIRLILNMHVPQGGFQSNGEGGALWSDAANQDRLTNLWKAIAARYADEPQIAGFGLLNEPEPLVDRTQWHDLAARIAAAIRAVDGNHMLFVERPIAIAGDFNADADMNFFLIDDPDTVYEFHFYDPTDYTFQLQPWNDTPDGGAYPDPSKIAGVTEQWINLATFDAPPAPAGTSDWTYYEGTRITASDARIAAGKPTLVGQALGAGVIAFDDLTIKEFDATGTYTRDIARILPSSTSGWYFWSSDNKGTGTAATGCKTSATCLTITGTDADASWGGYAYYFAPTPGYQYSLSGWMRGTNLPAGAAARIRLDLVGSSTPVTSRNRAGLAQMMAPYLAWGAAHDVPLFLGEFGVYKACFANDKGGLTWVGDAYDLATGGTPRVAAISYHQYHEDSFALYYGTGPVDPANANQPLIDLLTAKLQAAP